MDEQLSEDGISEDRHRDSSAEGVDESHPSSNERVLFLLNKHTGVAPYSHEFQLGGLDPQMLSGFVGAMGSFLGEFAGSKESTWKTVYGADSTFVVETGKWVVGVLAVSRETSRLRSQLRSIVREFKQTFGALKDADGLEGRVFEQFDQFVRRVFTRERIAAQSVLYWRRRCPEDLFVSLESPSDSYHLTKSLMHMRNGMSVSEISQETGVPLDNAKELLSHAFWRNMIDVKYVPSPNDILELSGGVLTKVLNPDNPLELSADTRRLLGALDGRTSLDTLSTHIPHAERDAVLQELGRLISMGVVSRITIELKLLLVNECILTRLAEACSELLQTDELRGILGRLIHEGVPHQPWLARVRIDADLSVICDVGGALSPQDLDWASQALEHLVDRFVDSLSARLCKRDAQDLLRYARKHCKEDWLSELTEGLI
jgi:hypothetical protein